MLKSFPSEGFEPTTFGTTVQRSNQLSYPGRTLLLDQTVYKYTENLKKPERWSDTKKHGKQTQESDVTKHEIPSNKNRNSDISESDYDDIGEFSTYM